MKKLIAAVTLLVLLVGFSLPQQAKALNAPPTTTQQQFQQFTQARIPAPTGQWIDAGSNEAAQVYFQPVQSGRLVAYYWMRMDYLQFLQPGVSSQLFFQEAQCSQGTYNTRYLVTYGLDKQLLAQGIPFDAKTPVIVNLDSPAGIAFRVACGIF